MDAGSLLSGTHRLALTIIEFGPISVTDAIAAWRRQHAPLAEHHGLRDFEAAIMALLGRGFIRVEDEGHLAITIAGRAALADCIASRS